MKQQPTVLIGKTKVPLKDFIAAVIRNTENKTIHFCIKDGTYITTVKFTIHVLPQDTAADVST